jgi:hypothetical protein
MRAAIRAAAVLLVAGAAASGAQGTERAILIPDAVSCTKCTITSTALTLRGSESVPLPDWPITVRVDGRGRIWLFAQDLPPRVFSANGKFLRLIGTRGAGPGEHRASGGTLVPLAGDTVGVFDFGNRRLSVVAPDLRTVRTTPNSFMFSNILPLDATHFVATGLVRTPKEAGHAVHFSKLDSDKGMVIEKSVGGSGVIPDPRSGGSEFNWFLSPASNGRFWTSEATAYRLQLWDQQGRSLLRLERTAGWFRPQNKVWLGNATTPPNPMGAGVSEDGPVLWTFSHVADIHWRDAWPAIPAGEESKGPDITEVVDTIVEAIDVTSGRVIARTRLPDRVVNALPGGRVVMAHHDANGDAQIQILTLRLKR